MSRRVTALVVALLLAGCAGPGEESTPDTLNQTDVMFVRMILPHHRQGVELAGLGRTKGQRAELVQLAAAIEATQADEVEMLAGILPPSGTPATAPGGDDPHAAPGGEDPHAAHGGLPGTSEEQVAALRAATGADFERRFLSTMMAHQGGAIRLARMELAGGADRRLVDLARRIERSRTAQVEQMRRLLER